MKSHNAPLRWIAAGAIGLCLVGLLWLAVGSSRTNSEIGSSVVSKQTSASPRDGVDAAEASHTRAPVQQLPALVDSGPSSTSESDSVGGGQPTVDEARLMATLDSVFRDLFSGPVNQTEVLTLMESVIDGVVVGGGERRADGSWSFHVPTKDDKSKVTVDALRTPEGNLKSVKVKIARPEVPGFSGDPQDVREGETSITLTTDSDGRATMDVHSSMKMNYGNQGRAAAMWDTYRGLGPIPMGGSTTFHEGGHVWTQTTARAVEFDGQQGWQYGNGQSSTGSEAVDVERFDRMRRRFDAVVPR